MSKTIRLTESQLRNTIMECVERIILSEMEELQPSTLSEDELNEECLDENWFTDKFKQIGSGVSALFGKDGQKWRERFRNVGKNFVNQGEINKLKNLITQLSDFVDAGQLNPNMTIAQLIGGKYRNGQFGRMSALLNNKKSQISKRGGNFYESVIYQ